MIGDFVIGEHKQTTAIAFENIGHYESYNINIDMMLLMILYLPVKLIN